MAVMALPLFRPVTQCCSTVHSSLVNTKASKPLYFVVFHSKFKLQSTCAVLGILRCTKDPFGSLLQHIQPR